MNTIVIIDDEKDICEIMEDILRGENDLSVHTALNGPDGISLIRQYRPDVVILDVKLQAGMDGVEVLSGIRESFPEIKVAVITGYVEDVIEQEIKDIGVDAYIEKPFTPSEILQAIRKLLESKERGHHG